jgi:hypothetical protein
MSFAVIPASADAPFTQKLPAPASNEDGQRNFGWRNLTHLKDAKYLIFELNGLPMSDGFGGAQIAFFANGNFEHESVFMPDWTNNDPGSFTSTQNSFFVVQLSSLRGFDQVLAGEINNIWVRSWPGGGAYPMNAAANVANAWITSADISKTGLNQVTGINAGAHGTATVWVTNNGAFVPEVTGPPTGGGNDGGGHGHDHGTSDSEYTTANALNILRIAAGIMEATDDMLKKYDLDGDGAITTADAVIVLRIAAGLMEAPHLCDDDCEH